MEFKRKKLLTIPLLKLSEGLTRYVKITGAMHLGKEQPADKDGKKKEPAVLASVINLEDGTECQIILSAVVKSVLTDEYANDSYVGKCFAITKQARAPGKAYNAYNVEEIEDPSAEAVVQHPASTRQQDAGRRGR